MAPAAETGARCNCGVGFVVPFLSSLLLYSLPMCLTWIDRAVRGVVARCCHDESVQEDSDLLTKPYPEARFYSDVYSVPASVLD